MAPARTHTSSSALNGDVPAQSTPATCPAWCAGDHPGPDPKYHAAWIHESVPRSVVVEEGTGTVLVTLSRFDELELPEPDTIGVTHILLAPKLEDHLAEYFLTCDEARVLLGAPRRRRESRAGTVTTESTRWGLSSADWRAHAVNPDADHPYGLYVAVCGHRLRAATALHRRPPGHRCPACSRWSRR